MTDEARAEAQESHNLLVPFKERAEAAEATADEARQNAATYRSQAALRQIRTAVWQLVRHQQVSCLKVWWAQCTDARLEGVATQREAELAAKTAAEAEELTSTLVG